MKTFKQFLDEEHEPQKRPGIRETIEKIAMPFLQRSERKGFLYRGVRSLGTSSEDLYDEEENIGVKLYVKTTRKDRVPLTMNEKLSKMIDAWFEEHFGFKARSAAIFCLGEAGRARVPGYGHQCIMFPMGSFTYVWSPKVVDLFYQAQHAIHTQKVIQADGGDQHEVDEWMKTLGFTTKGLDTAVTLNHEIMIGCESHALIPFSSINEVKVLYDIMKIKHHEPHP